MGLGGEWVRVGVGSALATILSMIFNFNTVLWLAMAAYIIATAAFVAVASNRLPGRRAAESATAGAGVGS